MSEVEVHPLTGDRWRDLVELFSRSGAAIPGRCWCMYYRQVGTGDSAEANREALRLLVDSNIAPGLIGYEDDSPVGWVSIGPHEDYESLRRSPVAKPIDDRPVWSIVCFFVDRRARGRGVAESLLQAAVGYARSMGARLVEAYPIDKDVRSENEVAFVGVKPMFERAGFHEVARRRPTRPTMRRALRRRET
jgi:ribosomal protein S18 acetylase RimI-like enzyme